MQFAFIVAFVDAWVQFVYNCIMGLLKYRRLNKRISHVIIQIGHNDW